MRVISHLYMLKHLFVAENGDARAWHDLRLQGFSAGGFALYVLFLVISLLPAKFPSQVARPSKNAPS